ncbi:hypothetical protein MJD09_15440, partial [bacterium]|nr:hypothetical protein [bacterium]
NSNSGDDSDFYTQNSHCHTRDIVIHAMDVANVDGLYQQYVCTTEGFVPITGAFTQIDVK